MASLPEGLWDDPLRIDPANPPRTVHPRKPNTTHLPILAVGRDGCYSELTGELATRRELVEVVRDHEPAILACMDPEVVLGELHAAFRSDPLWQFRLTPVQRQIGVGDRVQIREEQIVSLLGWRRRNGRQRNRYLYPVCPQQFGRHRLAELAGEGAPEWVRLLGWARSVREFCRQHDLRFSPTAGGIAAQLLRDPRFYPDSRRKVPMATNERARSALPGNHYELRHPEGVPVGSAWHIDQTSAHHYAASTVELPHPDHLYGRGYFRSDSEAPWLVPSNPLHRRAWARLRQQTGLLRLTVEVPQAVAERPFMPPHLDRPGRRSVHVFTNELDEIEELGARVLHVSAAWTSTSVDRGLPAYSEWARGESRQRPVDAPWLKGALLAAYGILGARPRRLESRWRWARKGEDGEAWIGAERVPVKIVRTENRVQSPIANVIARGMIEAETRRISLALARDLHQRGFDVLAIYADALLVRDTGLPLPLLPAPWRVKDRLSNLVFHNPQAFTSLEMQRLPGSPRAARMVETNPPSDERGPTNENPVNEGRGSVGGRNALPRDPRGGDRGGDRGDQLWGASRADRSVPGHRERPRGRGRDHGLDHDHAEQPRQGQGVSAGVGGEPRAGGARRLRPEPRGPDRPDAPDHGRAAQDPERGNGGAREGIPP